jgi:hypothetical protein
MKASNNLSENGKREKPLGGSKSRWENNIKTDLRKIGWSDMDWIRLAQERAQFRCLVNTVMNLRVPLNVGKFLSS